MTQKRFGKGYVSSRMRNKSGDPRFNWVILLVLAQSALLVFVLINQYKILKLNEPAQIGVTERTAEQALNSPLAAEQEVISPAEIVNPIRVEVLNGCRVSGLARRTADFLRNKAYDVRDFKNAPGRDVYPKTTIFVRCGYRAMGEKLAKTIALPLEMVKMEPDPNLVDIDVSLLLGKDYKQYVLPR